MVITRPNAANNPEIDRLKLLIPQSLQDAIDLVPAKQVADRLITTHRIKDRRCQIQLDLLAWQLLDIDMRNLLFWHEIARIQSGSLGSDRSEHIAIFAGLGIASIDIFADDIGMLAAALLVSGLAGFRLYQKHLGEQNLRKLTTADRQAIDLAVEFGYDRQLARDILRAAIQITMKKSRSRFRRDCCPARLQVLSLSENLRHSSRSLGRIESV